MPQTLPGGEIEQLSIPQRLDLIEQLWDSIPDTLEGTPVPLWHQRELDRRLAAADASPEAAIPWETVRARLQERK